MKSEEIVEEGIVISVMGSDVEVELSGNENCNECSARLFCKPKTDKSNVLKLKDVLDVKAGDVVRIAIKGSALFNATVVLYGLPLILLLAGLLIGLNLFSAGSSTEF